MFNLSVELTVDENFDVQFVKNAVNIALTEKFSLECMQIGKRVFVCDVLALIQQIKGVVNATINSLYDSEKNVDLFDLTPNTDEIFKINPNGIILKVTKS